MLSIIDIIYKGILIGILVSAPMGPIGLLCIQRTLNKGQWHGFFSGVGAALSDLFYAGMVCLGMGFVVDFIEGNQSILQIIGSIFLLAFGIYIFRSNPSKQLHKPKENINSIPQDIISAFFLTLSNPLIIFVYIVLFSRFNFISPEEKIYSMLLGLLCIIIGALSWWFLITFFVGKLRKVINLRGLWLINKIVGTVIIILSVVGFVYPLMAYI
ncbi:MAG: LysE family translocator [Candidatus Symbiothrix sp.]|jgi:threonine/homoserine/homoserine lactone efflux protein|nr:LysE family translocator [Candidatus Symbiothrix sp.]